MHCTKENVKKVTLAAFAATSAVIITTATSGVASANEVDHSTLEPHQSHTGITSIIQSDREITGEIFDVPLESGDRVTSSAEGFAVVSATGQPKYALSEISATDSSRAEVDVSFDIVNSQLAPSVSSSEESSINYPVEVTTQALPVFVVKCLVGLGIKGPDIVRIASMGTWGAIAGAFGRAAAACVFGK